jgi:hypothetical protein
MGPPPRPARRISATSQDAPTHSVTHSLSSLANINIPNPVYDTPSQPTSVSRTQSLRNQARHAPSPSEGGFLNSQLGRSSSLRQAGEVRQLMNFANRSIIALYQLSLLLLPPQLLIPRIKYRLPQQLLFLPFTFPSKSGQISSGISPLVISMPAIDPILLWPCSINTALTKASRMSHLLPQSVEVYGHQISLQSAMMGGQGVFRASRRPSQR